MGLLCKIVADFFFCVFKGSVVLELGLEVMAEGELLAVVAEETLDTGSVEFRRLVVFYVVDEIKGKLAAVYGDEELVKKAGGNIVGKMAVLAEGDAQNRPDILYLEKLPLFNADGTVKA